MFIHLIILAASFLSSCTTQLNHPLSLSKKEIEIKDSAPKGPIPTHFKPIKPKAEPLSRYGNPPSYRVNGHTYQVMTSANGYKTRGLASWYGTKFHRKRTSSGERYNMYALTAAHKTLPLPTYLKVKNLSNGKEAIIKVNDRGPFHPGRILDLSYGSAVKLGMFPRGTAMVEIEALNFSPKKVKQKGTYYLQAGAFSVAKNAEAMKRKLHKLIANPVYIEKYNHHYLVKLGPFLNRQVSEKMKNKLKGLGILTTMMLV